MRVKEMIFSEYKEEHRERVITLLSGSKGSDYYNKKSKIWDWQFNENPFAGDTNKNIVMIEDGEVIGFLGFMPAMLKYEDTYIEAFWGCDLILDPKYRGKGYGKKFADKFKTSGSIIIGFGINDIMAHIYKKGGFKVNRDIEKYYYTNKSTNSRDAVKKLLQHVIITKNIFNRPARGGLKASIIDASNTPEQIDSLWEKFESGYSKIITRKHSYIKWKYGCHPLTKYHLIIIESDDDIAGVGIFRKSDNMSKLVDYVGPAKNYKVKFLIVETFKKMCSHSNLLECVCTDEEFKASLECLGFRRYQDKPRFYIYSNIENDRDIEKNWFIMTGDSDNDLGKFNSF